MNWVVIVDDDDEARTMTAQVLKDEGMKVTCLASGYALLDYMEGMTLLPDLIILDIVMPEMDGFETLGKLREKGGSESKIPVIFLTGSEDPSEEKTGLSLGAVDFIRKPCFPDIMALRVKRTIELSHLQKDLYAEVEKKTRENNRLTLHVVQTLAEAIDAKDTYTNGHSGRVAVYSREIARRLGYDEASQDEIYMMGLLHDVGKIGVPDSIINKPAKLTDEEFEEIKKHPEVGNRILKKIKEMPKLADGARWHHERVDGKGYPDALSGGAIPEEARIIAVADAYDAMTSNRSYRSVLPQSVVRAELEKGKGSQFDDHIADIMIAMIDEDKDYSMSEDSAEKAGLIQISEEETIRHMDYMHELPVELAEIEQLDTELGMFLCGDPEDYLDALSVFAGSIQPKSEKIEKALSSGDIVTYTNLVHSLKSSSRTVGATEVSECARALEAAGKNNDTGILEEGTKQLLSMYKELEAPLKEILKKGAKG